MITTLDTVITISYIAFIVWLGFRAGMAGKKGGNAAGEYFLAGKSLRWPVIGMALFATNISCLHLVSLAQSGFDTGLITGNYEWMSAFTLILLALFFVPFYIRSGIATLPDFLERRYNRACRDWLAIVSVVSAVVIHIAFSFLAGGIVLETLFGINMFTSIIVIAIITGAYTIMGGLRAVVVTESVQTMVLLAGAVIITVLSWWKVGGWQPVLQVLQQEQGMEKLSMLHGSSDPSGLPWYAIFLGYPVIGIWYWCADQTIVQRVLGARDENHAKAGALFCGVIKMLPVFIFILPGLLAYVLYRQGQLDLSALKAADGVMHTKGIYSLMITQLVPPGLVGVLVAALLSGLMSQISGALNSIATLVSYDLYKRYRPEAADKQLVKIGRWAAGIALLLSLALLPLLNRYESLFHGINDVISHIAPPITCVFLLGIFWRKASAKSAQYTLWLGSVLGAGVYAVGKLMPGGFISQVPPLMMAFYLFMACAVCQVALSFLFPVQDTAGSERLYWKSPLEPLRLKGWPGLADYRVQSVLLLSVMAILYWCFR
ncbi:SSS family solute:Na+ symporter [Chitinophaga polysaccharea]|uniref:SSS family solute:Na+ symporter n=1 Tax=Chitinophaga polysaccharea TaxID=1293035 RepID=A0A561PR17_9BACT|nr:sodium/solute symporter [Chitinophaga polysaccharea]TWF40558.1 SSS family solute:Na+ symporter [Chitinophaga polysaccharea]